MTEMTTEPLAGWQVAFRQGVAPQLSTAALERLADGLLGDDPALVQGWTTEPPPVEHCLDEYATGGCLLCYGLMADFDGPPLVADLAGRFGDVCRRCDEALGLPGAVGYLLRAWDDLPRAEARALFRAEVERTLLERAASVAA